MGVSIRQKGKKLYLDIYSGGRRRWERLGLTVCADKKQNAEVWRVAELCRSQRELQVVSGEWGLVDPVKSRWTLVEYMRSVSEGHGAVSQCLVHLEKYSDGGVLIGRVTAEWLEGFQRYLAGLVRPSTVNVYISGVRFAMARALRDRVILHDPCGAVRQLKAVSRKREHLTVDELGLLAGACVDSDIGVEIKRAFLFACCVGLRVSDIKQLMWGDIEWKPLQIVKRQQKTGELVYIPINDSAWALINDGCIHGHGEAVFPLLHLMKSTRLDILREWGVRAGLGKRLGWHTARHTFAVLSLDSGADIYTVSKLLGHTNVQTTQVYAVATDRRKRDVVDALPEIRIA